MLSFWNNDHPLMTEYQYLAEIHIPSYGPCELNVGECLRAASKIAYDFYNNGFGNNWSGAYNYLLAYGRLNMSKEDLDFLGEYKNEVVFFDEANEELMERIVNDLVANVVTNAMNGVYGEERAFCDMFQMEDKTVRYEDEYCECCRRRYARCCCDQDYDY